MIEARAPRRQADRSATTRDRLLNATMECLSESGYSNLTTKMVESRAGVSRGALLHHYPSKKDLLVAAVGYMARRWEREILDSTTATGETGVSGLLRMLSRQFDAPLSFATMEIWVAARTDPTLRAALQEQEAELQTRLFKFVRDFLNVDFLSEEFQIGVKLYWQFLRGAAVSGIVERGPGEQVELLASLERLIAPLFDETPPPAGNP